MAEKQKQDGEKKPAAAKPKAKVTANAVQKYLEEIEKLDLLKAKSGEKAASEVEAIIVGLVKLFNAGQSLQKMYDGALAHEAVSVPVGAFNKAVVAAFEKRDGVDKDRLQRLNERIAKNQASGLKIKSGTETVPKGHFDALQKAFNDVAAERDDLVAERDQLVETNRQLEADLKAFADLKEKTSTKAVVRQSKDIALLVEALKKNGISIPDGVSVQATHQSTGLSGGDQDSGLRTPMGAVPQTEAKD